MIHFLVLFTTCLEFNHALRLISHHDATSDSKDLEGVWPIDSLKMQVVETALRNLENVWPMINGKDFLESTTNYRPPEEAATLKLRARLRARFERGETFVFAAFGDSITAGHENFFNQSWPVQLQKILEPTFTQLGFGFEARNRGLGGWGAMPYSAGCLANRAGSEVDVISWEYRMVGDTRCEMYQFMKETEKLERKPVIFEFADEHIIFDNPTQGGTREHRDEFRHEHTSIPESTTDKGYKDHEYFLSEEFVSEKDLQSWAKAFNHDRAECKNDVKYNTIFGSHFSREWITDIVHFVTSASSCHVQHLPFYQSRDQAFSISWHPGPLGHYLLAAQTAHFILSNMAEVFSSSTEVFKHVPGPSPDNPVVDHTRNISEKEKLEGECGSLVATHCWTGISPSTSSLVNSSIIGDSGKWTYQQDYGFKGYEDQGYQDLRNVFQANMSSGPMRLQITIDPQETEGSYLLVCGATCGWACEGFYGYISASTQRWWNEDLESGFQGKIREDAGCDPRGTKEAEEDCNARLGFKGRCDDVTDCKGEGRREVTDMSYDVDGVEVPVPTLTQLQTELFSKDAGLYCRDCPKPMDLCQVVAKLSPGEHSVQLRVTPRTWRAEFSEYVTVKVAQVMLVGSVAA